MENLKEKDYYREKIIELVEKINNQGTLEYLYTFIKLFLGRIPKFV